MTRTAKMMMLSGRGRRRIGVEYEDYPRDYVEDKFRDRRGRERYDDGRFAPRSEMMEPYDRGYRRYSDGRFAPRSEYDMQGRYGVQDRYIPPVYHYPMYREDYDMQPIGFRDRDYGSMHETPYVGDSLRGSSERMMGHAPVSYTHLDVYKRQDFSSTTEYLDFSAPDSQVVKFAKETGVTTYGKQTGTSFAAPWLCGMACLSLIHIFRL